MRTVSTSHVKRSSLSLSLDFISLSLCIAVELRSKAVILLNLSNEDGSEFIFIYSMEIYRKVGIFGNLCCVFPHCQSELSGWVRGSLFVDLFIAIDPKFDLLFVLVVAWFWDFWLFVGNSAEWWLWINGIAVFGVDEFVLS